MKDSSIHVRLLADRYFVPCGIFYSLLRVRLYVCAQLRTFVCMTRTRNQTTHSRRRHRTHTKTRTRWHETKSDVFHYAGARLKEKTRGLSHASLAKGCNLILTTGGTGCAPRDVTPEATAAVVHKLVPGIPQAILRHSLRYEPHAMLSRAVAGIRDRALVINLPGRPKAVRENLGVLMPVMAHAVSQVTQ